MAYLLNCPNCGERNVYEFRFGGEVLVRPPPETSQDDWATYFYTRRNTAGVAREWWYHKFGCRKWCLALRDTVTNEIQETSWPQAGLR
jgi:sarcosine oxidase subunit delta